MYANCVEINTMGCIEIKLVDCMAINTVDSIEIYTVDYMAINTVGNGYNTDPAILKLLESLQKEIQNLKVPSSDPPTPSSDSDDLPLINPRTNQPYKRYCWTHGCGSHWSNRCRNPKAGHKNEATFRNRMGGSNKGCLPAIEKK